MPGLLGLGLLHFFHIGGFQSSPLTLLCLLSRLSILYNLFFLLLKPHIQIIFLKDRPKLDSFLNAKSILQIISDTIPAGPFSTEMGLAFTG